MVDNQSGDAGGESAVDGRKEVHAPGRGAEGNKEGPQLAQEDVKGVAGGVGNAQQRRGKLVLAGIAADNAGGQGEQVEGEDDKRDGQEKEA
jgi:hypothetical protein